jgi:alpha-beta hydrolase superfamily lysophospholipase
MREESFEGTGGLEIFARSWKPEGRPRGIVVLVHGFKAHSGLYEWPAQQLVQRGFAVHAPDLRGHGRSGGERLFVHKFSEYVDDVHRTVQLAKAREPGLPTFVLGHSAGGVVSCLYALEHQDDIKGLVCESFAHEVPAPDFALSVLKGIGHIAPHAHVLSLKDEDFSRDPAFVERMKNDPLIPKFGYPAQTAGELVRADERLKKEFPLITLPVLIVHGTQDKATRPHGSQRFFDSTGARDKTLKLYEGGFHDLLNDIDRERVMADIIEWISMRTPAAASA